jgi:hypothetical protein
MKKLIALIIGLAALSVILTGCDCENNQNYHHRVHHSTQQNVTVYKEHNPNYVVGVSSPSDEWIFWYLMYSGNNYYYYSTPTYIPTTSYSSISWSESKTSPINTTDATKFESVEQNTIDNSGLSQEVTSSIQSDEVSISSSSSSDLGSDVGGSVDAGGSTSSSSSSDFGGGDAGGSVGGGDAGGYGGGGD